MEDVEDQVSTVAILAILDHDVYVVLVTYVYCGKASLVVNVMYVLDTHV